jgi:type II secretory pathway pseudopilin PulG
MLVKKRQTGFTLIEAVVATAVFAFAIASALGVYMATIRLDTKSRAERSVQQNARFIMDYFAKEIRNGSIDYTSINDADTLSVVNQLDQQEVFEWGGLNNPVLTLNKSGLGTTNLNSSDVRVTNLRFYLHPSENPFILANDEHVQPHVTVVMTIQSVNTKAIESSTINLQSTFAVREYPSRE